MSLDVIFDDPNVKKWVDRIKEGPQIQALGKKMGKDSFLQDNSVLRKRNSDLELQVDQLKYDLIVMKIERDKMKVRMRRALNKSDPQEDNSITVNQYEYINLCRENETFYDRIRRLKISEKNLKKENKKLKKRVEELG